MRKTIYSALVQLTIHAESITWSRFHNFLITNSILILVWAALYTNRPYSLTVKIVLLFICVIGVFSGLLWAGLGYRGREYLYLYMGMGREFEREAVMWANRIPDGYKMFLRTQVLAEKLGRDWHCSWAFSRRILTIVPLAFTIFFIVLAVAAYIQPTQPFATTG